MLGKHWVLILLLALCGGCSTQTVGSRIGATPGFSDERAVSGDWDDVPAAVYGAVRGQEVTVLSTERTPGVQKFELITIRDEPGLVAARPDPSRPGSIIIRCTLGYFGDADRENQILDRIARRLKELEGVGARPLNW